VSNVQEDVCAEVGMTLFVRGRSGLNIHERLEVGRACLERIDRERKFRSNRNFGKALEDRIMRRELFDLELQELDERVERLSEVVRTLSKGLPAPRR
jgi:hypothetical protein